jgi:hypothetical protein
VLRAATDPDVQGGEELTGIAFQVQGRPSRTTCVLGFDKDDHASIRVDTKRIRLCQFQRESFRSDFGSHSGAGIVINVSDF